MKEKHDIIVDKYGYKEYFIKNIIEDKPLFKCPLCNWTTVDINNKSGWTTIHLEREHNLKSWEFYEKYPEYAHMWSYYGPRQKRRHDIIEGGEYNYITCLECGEKFLKLNRTHLATHNMTIKQYKIKYKTDTAISSRMRDIQRDIYYKNDKLRGTQYTSNAELQLQEFLDSIEIPHIPHYMMGYNELDLYLADNNLAIEFDGLYYHSELGAGKSIKYHLNKTTVVENAGDRLIHIFEDEWKDNPEILKGMIASYCDVYKYALNANNCDCSEISKETANKFLLDNHIFGPSQSDRYFGIYNGADLYYVMGFSINGTTDYILDRYCNTLHYNIINGFNTLLKFSVNILKATTMTYIGDRRFIHRDVERSFNYNGKTPPDYWYLITGEKYLRRYNKSEFTIDKILEKFPNADPNLSEWENMKLLGYDRIWDCGSKKYIKTFN